MDIIHANRKLKVLLSDYFAQKRLSILEWLYFSKKCFFPSRTCFYRGEKWGRDKKRSIEPAKFSAGNTLVTSHGWQHRSDFLRKKRNTKSLSGWKLKCTSSEKLMIRWETRSKALQVIKHMVCITTSLFQAFGQWSAAWRSCLLLCSHLFEQSPRSERFHNYTEVCARSMPGVL